MLQAILMTTARDEDVRVIWLLNIPTDENTISTSNPLSGHLHFSIKNMQVTFLNVTAEPGGMA